jgi:hypothetical protein
MASAMAHAQVIQRGHHFLPGTGQLLPCGLALQGVEQIGLLPGIKTGLACQSAENADMAQVDMHVVYRQERQGLQRQGEYFDIAFDAGMTEQFRPDL